MADIVAFLLMNFNPRTHKGCDPRSGSHHNFLWQFQSTHP